MSRKYIFGMIAICFLLLPSLLGSINLKTREPPLLSSFQVPQTSISWDLSDYYNYTVAPMTVDTYKHTLIYIDDSNPAYNWTVWSSFPWLTGSGTWADPYVIEWLYLNAQESSGCIFIYHSIKPFIIRHCYLNNTGVMDYDDGIFMHYVKNGQVYGNIINYAKVAVHLEDTCYNISVYRNYLQSDEERGSPGRAFKADWEVDNCNFTQNVINNYQQLAHVSTSHNISIDGNLMNNTIYEEYVDPVIIFSSSSQMKFRYNILTDNYKWFDFGVDVVDSVNNTIIDNTVISSLTGIQVPTPLLINPVDMRPAQATVNIMELSSSNNNLIANNYLYVPGEGGAIPSFDPFLLLGVMGCVSLMAILTIRKKRKVTYII